MKKTNVFWLLALVFLMSSFSDITNGYMPKPISSIFLTIGFVMLAQGQNATKKNSAQKNCLVSLFDLAPGRGILALRPFSRD